MKEEKKTKKNPQLNIKSKMKLSREFGRLYIIPIVLLTGIVISTILTVFFTSTVLTPEGRIVSTSWPKDFTLDYVNQIVCDDNSITLTDNGIQMLQQNGLWLQILNADGKEVFGFDIPDTVPSQYRPKELLEMFQEGNGTSTVFVSSFTDDKTTYTYMIGFPLSLSKVISYVDDSRYQTGKYLIIAAILLTILLIILLTVFYYIKILKADRQRTQDEKARKEWLTNITHDLKTPLAPIRGYAELLAETSLIPDIPLEYTIDKKNLVTDFIAEHEKIRQYGAIILKNVLYAEQLVDDLKLTYQLQSNMLPLNTEKRNLARFVKEIIIDLMNAPEYEGRKISFSCDNEELLYNFDDRLLKRALLNVLINSLKHNTPDTTVSVIIQSSDDITIIIQDNGCGMSSDELEGLFTRYYRGTNTETKTEGSGLGMAIARQIIEAHGGTIQAESILHRGTMITIQLK